MNDGPFRDNGLTHEDLAPVWDAVFATYPLVTAHITGPMQHDAVGLEQCVRVFHAEAIRLQQPVRPDLLLAMFSRFPNGAFAHRVGTELFARDVNQIWQGCIDELRQKKQKEAEEVAEAASWLSISDEPWDEDALPPRPWLGPPYFMRGQISLLHGPGSAGKSMLIVVWTLALALGKAFGRLKPKQRCRVLLTNFEDDEAEQMRRISAALRWFDAKPSDLTGWLFRVSLGPKGDATMFELAEHGPMRTTPCFRALEHACETIRPDAVALDPFVAINAVPENDNQLMRRVMTTMKFGLAQRFGCALALAHHDNKSGSDDEDSDQTNARGGGDIVNAVRLEAAIKKMTTKQAEAWGIEAARRGLFFRAGSVASKRNYTAPEEGEWFERRELAISGEAVVYCVPWQPPSARLDDQQTAQIVAAVEKGTRLGPYSTQLTNTSRSLAPVLTAIGIAEPAMQRQALTNLIDAGHIAKAKWRPKGQGDKKAMTGLRANGLPYDVEWVEEEDP